MLDKRLIAIAATALCTLAGQALAQTPTLRIQDYPGIGNFLVRVANANGLCEKHGLKCELRAIPQAPLGMQTLLAGDIEVAFGPPEVMLQAVNKGADVKVVASGARAPTFFLMARAGLETPNAAKGYPAVMQDFKGKKIGVTARGAGAEFQLISLLKGAGMQADDVTIVAVGAPNTAFPAIVQKQIDGLVSFTPMDGFCEVSKSCRIVVDPRQGQGPTDLLELAGASNVQVMRGDFAKKNAKLIAGYQQALKEATDLVQNPANFAAMLKVAQDSFKINTPGGDKVLEIALRNSLPSLRYPVDPKALQNAAMYMQRTGQIDKVIDTAPLLMAQ